MSDSAPHTDDGPSQRTIEIGVAVGMLVFAALVIYGSLKAGINWGAEGPRAGFFPFYVALAIVIASAINLYRIATDGGASRRLFAEWGQLRQVLSVIVPTTAYVLLIPWIGLYVASLILIAVFMRWLGKYRWPLVAAVACGVPLVAYVLFEKWFLVPLPKGPLEDFLGL
jgi:putative tricarboxylic transport membrane protein